METNEIQIDFQKVIKKYNTQLGEVAGRTVLLEAEIETLKDYIEVLERQIPKDTDEGPSEAEEVAIKSNGKPPALK